MTGIPAGAGQLIGKRLGQYEIVALLALGGTAEIYLARIDGTAGFEKYVVIKCLHDHLADDPDFVKMFLDEARIAATLDHSNIVQTFELGEHEGRYYIAMEFLAGLSLAMIVRRAAERVPGGRIPVPLTLTLALQTAAGLHYAHERVANGAPLNLVHRDVSPQNLVIGFEGVLKVVDFGIARAELRETKTKAGTIKGKFAYMSPEQSIATNIDRRTDVFALGVIVHELLTGKRLFKRNSPYETYQAVIECNVPPPSSFDPSLDPALDPIILRATARDKDERYPTAEAFGDALDSYMHARGISSAAGELGRFFEQYFQIEIDEHGDRMRELLAGREFSVDTGVTWGEEDEKKHDSGRHAGDDDVQIERIASRLATESDAQPAGADDGQAPEKTRIEVNPLDLIKDMERGAGGSGQMGQLGRPGTQNGSAAGPRNTPPKVMQAETAILPDAGASGQQPRFVAERQLPTLIADPRNASAEPSATTAPGIAGYGRSATAPPSATTSAGISGPPPAAQHAHGRARNATRPDMSIAPTAMAVPIDPNRTVPTLDEVLASVTPSPGPPPGPAPSPSMSAAMSAGMSIPIGPASATHAAVNLAALGGDLGATVPSISAIDDSTPPPNSIVMQHDPQPQPQHAHAQHHHAPQPMPGPLPIPAPPSQQLQLDPNGSQYPVLHGGRPFSSDLAPSSPAQRPVRMLTPAGTVVHGHGGGTGHASGAYAPNGAAPQHAANMMSPVGDNYNNDVNWPAEAARRARALKPWQLALLFVGVLGIALLLTLVIAKIAH